MPKFPLTPRLINYTIGLPNEVWQSHFNGLPIRQRHATHNAYTAQVSFVLNGRDHDRLMAFYQAYRGDFIEVVLTLDDSKPKPYTALIVGDVVITPLGTRHTPTPSEILAGTANTKGAYYQTDLTLMVQIPTDKDGDKALVENYERQNFSQKDYQTILKSLGYF